MIKNNLSWSLTLIYFNTTEKCKKFNKLLLENNIKSGYITGDTSSSKRQEIKDKINNKTLNIICLCGCWNEGVSINNIQTVIFGDLRHSEINKTQIVSKSK